MSPLPPASKWVEAYEKLDAENATLKAENDLVTKLAQNISDEILRFSGDPKYDPHVLIYMKIDKWLREAGFVPHKEPAAAPQRNDPIFNILLDRRELSDAEQREAIDDILKSDITFTMPEEPAAAPQPGDIFGVIRKGGKLPIRKSHEFDEPALQPAPDVTYTNTFKELDAKIATLKVRKPKAAAGDSIDKLVANVQKLHAGDICECGHSLAEHNTFPGTITGGYCIKCKSKCRSFKAKPNAAPHKKGDENHEPGHH